MPFDQWLQSKMTQHDFSKYRIAKMAGVHQSTVAGWLSGSKPQPQKEELVRQAMREYENSKESDLTGGEKGIKKDLPQGEAEELDAVTRELLNFARNGTPEQKKDALLYIQFRMSKE